MTYLQGKEAVPTQYWILQATFHGHPFPWPTLQVRVGQEALPPTLLNRPPWSMSRKAGQEGKEIA